MRKNQDDEQILVFRVGQVVCSVTSRLIESIVDNQTLHRFPGQADFILGVLHYRDHAVSIVNLFNKFGVDEPRANRDSCFIMGSTVHGLVGFWVDEVLEVTTQYDYTDTKPPVFSNFEVFESALLWNDKLVLQTDLNCLFSMADSAPLQQWVEETNNIDVPLPEMNHAVEPVDEISWNQAVYDASVQEIGSLMSRGADFTHETVALLDDEALSAKNDLLDPEDLSDDEYTEEQLSLFFQTQTLTEYEPVEAQPVSQFDLNFNPMLETPPEVDSEAQPSLESDSQLGQELPLEQTPQPAKEPPLKQEPQLAQPSKLEKQPSLSKTPKLDAQQTSPKDPVLSKQRKRETAIELKTVRAIAEKYGDVRQVIDNNIAVSRVNKEKETRDEEKEKIETPILSVSQAEVPKRKPLKSSRSKPKAESAPKVKQSATSQKTKGKYTSSSVVAKPSNKAEAQSQIRPEETDSVPTTAINKPAVESDTAFLHTSYMLDDFDEPASRQTQSSTSSPSSILATTRPISSLQTRRRETAKTNFSSDFSDSIPLDYLDDEGEPFAFSSDVSVSSLDSTSEFSVLEEGVDSFIPLQRKNPRSKRDEAVEKVANRIVRKQESKAGASKFRYVSSILIFAFFVFFVQHYWMNENDDEIMANVPRLQLLEERDSFKYQKMEATLETVADKYGDEYSLKRPLQEEIVTLDDKLKKHFSLVDNVLQGSVR